jgi:hypothetical protein
VRVEVKVPVTESARLYREEAYDLESCVEPDGRDAELTSLGAMVMCVV